VFLRTSSVSIPRFILLINGRFRKRGGEVAVYVAKILSPKCIIKSPAGSPTEILLAEIKAGMVYLSAASGSVSSLLDYLSQLSPGYDLTSLMGDFNTNQQTLLSQQD
jgi:hypothetical protein